MSNRRADKELKATLLDFTRIESLRLLCAQILEYQVVSIDYFRSGVGFKHVYDEKKDDDISVSSSATCVLSLAASGKWKSSKKDTDTLAKKLLEKNRSAGLEEDNPFTTAWILDAITVLQQDIADPFIPDTDDKAKIDHKEKKLREAVERGNGAVSIGAYPGSAYLTQLVVRVLRRRGKLNGLETLVNDWALNELRRQLALVQASSNPLDAFAFAYLVILVTAGTPTAKISPEIRSIQRAALRTVFDCQLTDGTWPPSKPLFHYPKVGNAHCYEYEMLTQLLQEPDLDDLLLDYLPELGLACESLKNSVYRLDKGVQAWSSGHHPQLPGPESWTTASVYHFVHRFNRLLSEAVRRELFLYLDLPLPGPTTPPSSAEFASDLLDSKLSVKGKERFLKDFLLEDFVKPLADQAGNISNGGKFKKGTAISAIFHGPPGTSKTELSKKIAEFLGWPLLTIDPSHLLRNGMDGIQAEANAIFRRLAETERVVVLLDEFDEFVRERGSSDAEQFSRLLTTGMLPKLASIHKRATLVLIIATNNIRWFDLAIQRPGRFDRLVQIMPPIYDEKLKKKNWGAAENVDVEKKLAELEVTIDGEIKQRLGDFTFLEYDAFATDLANASTGQEALKVLEYHYDRCILKAVSQDSQTANTENKTWKERCKDDERFNR
jgi:hypothetical protein